METFLRPPLQLYRQLNRMYISTRSFKAGRRSIGLGSSLGTGQNSQNKFIKNFYQDTKMEKLWNNTFERISSLQKATLNPQRLAGINSNNINLANPNSHDAEPRYQSPNNLFDANRDSSSTNYLSREKPNLSGKQPIFPIADQDLMKLSFAEGYFYGQSGKKTRSFFKEVLYVCLFGWVIYIFYNSEGQIKKALYGSYPRELEPHQIDVSFDSVKGCDEAKKELSDIVEFLMMPEKFSEMGGKLPKGLLLVGPPGTGKTLLARAVAGEAGVPFFHTSGSEFDEMLVGQGARRIRDLFDRAKQRAPCVIFIDEIDSVGGKRTQSAIHPYANQTINQLLNEMDGFSQTEGVIVIGATNRANDLDKALLRPGRFDIMVHVQAPDYKGRHELFQYYLNKVRAHPDIDLDVLCRSTIGFTGADIENLVNQGALKSAIENLETVTQEALMFARDKILMGPERHSRLPNEQENLMTAYHESGHTLVAMYTENAMKVHKVTIVSRNQSLGHTAMLPDRDRNTETKEQLTAAMDVCLGGRIAEELVFGVDKATTGCANDLDQANGIASTMVKNHGFSEKLGLMVIRGNSDGQSSDVSDATSELVDSEIGRLLNESKQRVRTILTEHMDELKLLAEALMKYETLNAKEVKLAIEGKNPRPHINGGPSNTPKQSDKPNSNKPPGSILKLPYWTYPTEVK